MKKATIAVCGAAVLTLSLTGCTGDFEGSGSKDAASAEQLALRTDDPWAKEIVTHETPLGNQALSDGIYQGSGKGMEGRIGVTLLVEKGHITCLETTQEGESQSRGGYEAIRDGVFAAMIDAAQGSDIDAVSGATITTAGVRQAVDDALSQAVPGASMQLPTEVAQSALRTEG